MSSLNPLMPPMHTCFVDAVRADVHQHIDSRLRAPLLGGTDWRIGTPVSSKMMERRGWIQPVCATVTTPEQIAALSAGTERIYIPGEFCRQGDVLSAAAESGKIILLERGAFLAPNDIIRAVDKLAGARDRLILCEAGSAFGYSDRILDPRALGVLAALNLPLALNVGALSMPAGHAYEHKPDWISATDFDETFVTVARAFKVQYLLLPAARPLSPAAIRLWLNSAKDGQ